MRKRLCLVFRKPNPRFFSIEKVFTQLSGAFKTQMEVSQVNVPHYSSSVTHILKNIFRLRRQKADIYHITGDIHYNVLSFPAKKTILTIHDCVFLYNYTGIKKIIIDRLFLKWPVKHCRYVTTISEKSKEEIVRFSGCKPEKVFVIPNPLPATIFFEQKTFNEQKPRLLFVGTTPNKNLPRAMEALRGLSCHLRIIGQIDEATTKKLKEHQIDFSTASQLTEQQLAREYADADMILYPSLYEGFGLPVLEGQKAGRPVLTSNISPMKDVAGGAACLVDPNDAGSIRKGIEELIRNKSFREALIANGFANVERYTTEAVALQYEKVYQLID